MAPGDISSRRRPKQNGSDGHIVVQERADDELVFDVAREGSTARVTGRWKVEGGEKHREDELVTEELKTYLKDTLGFGEVKSEYASASSSGGGGGGVEVRTDDPSDPSVGDSWFNTTEDVLRVAYDDGGSVGVREVRSVFSEAGVRVVEDFEGQTMSNLQALGYVTADQQITQQNGSDRLEITAAPSEFAGVYWSEQTDEVGATFYLPNENTAGGIMFGDSNGSGGIFLITNLTAVQASEPSILLFDQINNQTIDTVAVTPSNWTGGDVEFTLRLDGDGNVIGEATDINGDTTTLSGSAPTGLSKEGYGVQGQKIGGSGESKIYIDDVKAFAEGQEVSPALSVYARIDAVPDAYINSGGGVTDNGSGLEVVETEVDHDSLNNYEAGEHHPVFVKSSLTESEYIEDAIWVDTSQSPPRIKRFDGSGWLTIDEYVSSHDNTAHSTEYATTNHDNTAHSTDYATTNHDNTAHSTDYATTNHDNTAHSETYALDSDIVDDHTNLTNVQTDQHHTRPSAGTGITEDASDNFNIDESARRFSPGFERRDLTRYKGADWAGIAQEYTDASYGDEYIRLSSNDVSTILPLSSMDGVNISDNSRIYVEFGISVHPNSGEIGWVHAPPSVSGDPIKIVGRGDGTDSVLVVEYEDNSGNIATEEVDRVAGSSTDWYVGCEFSAFTTSSFVISSFDVEVRYDRSISHDGFSNTFTAPDVGSGTADDAAKGDSGAFVLNQSGNGEELQGRVVEYELF